MALKKIRLTCFLNTISLHHEKNVIAFEYGTKHFNFDNSTDKFLHINRIMFRYFFPAGGSHRIPIYALETQMIVKYVALKNRLSWPNKFLVYGLFLKMAHAREHVCKRVYVCVLFLTNSNINSKLEKMSQPAHEISAWAQFFSYIVYDPHRIFLLLF